MSVKDVEINTPEAASLASPEVISSNQKGEITKDALIVVPSSETVESSAPISPPIPSPTIEGNGTTTNGNINDMDVDKEEHQHQHEHEYEEKPVHEHEHDQEQRQENEHDQESQEIGENDDQNKSTTPRPEEPDNKSNTATNNVSETPTEVSILPGKHDRPDESSITNGNKRLKTEEKEPEEVKGIAEVTINGEELLPKSPEHVDEMIVDEPTTDIKSEDSNPQITESVDSITPATPPLTDSSTQAVAAATEGAAPSIVTPSEPAPPPRDYSELDPDSPSEGPLPKHQAKFALSVIRSVKRLKDSAPFSQPVDTVKLGIPTYYDYVKEPMDLSTIEKKVTAGEYDSVVAFVHDFELIVSNCILFNGKDSFISNMVRNLEASFHKHMTNMPRYDAPPGISVTKPKKKSSIIPPANASPKPQRAAAQAANAANAAAASNDHTPRTTTALPTTATPKASTPTPTPKSDLRSAATTSSSSPGAADSSQKPFALQPSGIPTIRRESAVEGGRPKREIHPPKSKDLPYGDIKPRRKKFAAELKFCGQVIKDLFSKKHEAYSFPFLQPVDPVALNCPSYFKVIKEPMDLGTVQEKYNKNQYENGDDFAYDVRLIFKNCYKFNPEGSPVNVMGHKLEAAFEKKWLEKPQPPTSPPPPPDSSDEEFSDFDIEINESRITNPAIEFLEEQLERIKSQLATLRKEAAKEAREARRASLVAASKKRRKSTKGAIDNVDGRRKSGPAPRRASSTVSALNAPVHVTYEMKKELSDKIQLLSEKKLRHVVGIIEESMPQLKNSAQDDEIELDMDQLDPNTLLRLYNFVVKREDHKSKPPKSSTHGSSGGGRKKKSKPLSEAEQSRQIEELQKKIRQFDRMKEGSDESSSEEEAGGNGASSDDSSSEEE